LPSEEYIVIRGSGSISPLGYHKAAVMTAYRSGKPGFQVKEFKEILTPVGALPTEAEIALQQLVNEKKAYQSLDRSVLMAMLASRQAVIEADWAGLSGIAVNIGSSRGATGLFEQYYQEFMQKGTVPAHTSPLTTLGNISSWVAQDLNLSGPSISHSVTCSTGLQALANGLAWLKAGMADKFIAGASEAPLTPFTIAQMKAIGIYATNTQLTYPCRPLNHEKHNTFVLGEGAAVFALEKVNRNQLKINNPKPVIVEAIGFGFEPISSKTGISKEGDNFRLAMTDALQKAITPEPVDLVIMHAPGTVVGDSAEWQALNAVFKEAMPVITSSKWLTGHTLGASSCLSVAYALQIFDNQKILSFPYLTFIRNKHEAKKIKKIMIMAAGFGGNAAAILLSRPD